MRGIFKQKPILLRLSYLSLACFLLSRYLETELANDIIAYVGLAVILILCLIWIFFNRKAYIYLKGSHIKGKFGLFKKIDCSIDDIAFATFQKNTLTILLKNGKSKFIIGLLNPHKLCYEIRKKILFDVTESKVNILDTIKQIKTQRKRKLVFCCCTIALMFIIIFLTVLLTAGKDFEDFNKIDWYIMIVMGVLELFSIILAFYFAETRGKSNIIIDQLYYKLQRTIIETHKLPPGNVKNVYADNNYIGRVIIFSYPNDSSVYYSIEKFDPDYNLIVVYTSEVYVDKESLPEGLDDFIDITDKFDLYSIG